MSGKSFEINSAPLTKYLQVFTLGTIRGHTHARDGEFVLSSRDFDCFDVEIFNKKHQEVADQQPFKIMM